MFIIFYLALNKIFILKSVAWQKKEKKTKQNKKTKSLALIKDIVSCVAWLKVYGITKGRTYFFSYLSKISITESY